MAARWKIRSGRPATSFSATPGCEKIRRQASTLGNGPPGAVGATTSRNVSLAIGLPPSRLRLRDLFQELAADHAGGADDENMHRSLPTGFLVDRRSTFGFRRRSRPCDLTFQRLADQALVRHALLGPLAFTASSRAAGKRIVTDFDLAPNSNENGLKSRIYSDRSASATKASASASDLKSGMRFFIASDLLHAHDLRARSACTRDVAVPSRNAKRRKAKRPSGCLAYDT